MDDRAKIEVSFLKSIQKRLGESTTGSLHQALELHGISEDIGDHIKNIKKKY